jgi:hypothetical protein
MPDKLTSQTKSDDAKRRAFWGKLSWIIPKVRRPYLFGLAGILWTVAGGILCVRGAMWLQTLPDEAAAALIGGSVLIGGAGYFFGFSKIVRKNIARIMNMPEQANLFAFTAARGYLLIGLMMTFGITLRRSSLPKYYLIVPYCAMGGMLLAGSIRFYRAFIASLRENPSADLRR